ncbi:MAG: GatB/YqeY domain-containing protein [Verrucomicrobiota bacterium]|nr:GatB/YqeY domain-containing protein [Verrucomicrobiota bacterium]
MAIIDELNNGIKEAIKGRDTIRLETLRMLKSKILAADARATLPDAEVIKLFRTYYGNLQEALEQTQLANRPEMVEKLQKELVIVQEFLPKAPSLEETKKIVEEAIATSGAKSRKEIGLVMRAAIHLNSAVDRKTVNELASQLLP